MNLLTLVEQDRTFAKVPLFEQVAYLLQFEPGEVAAEAILAQGTNLVIDLLLLGPVENDGKCLAVQRP